MKNINLKNTLMGLGMLVAGVVIGSESFGMTPQEQKAKEIETRLIQNQARNTGVNLISELEAKKVATEVAGVNINEVQYFKVKLEQEDDYRVQTGKPVQYVYEVEFLHGGFEYEFDIDAETKQVLKSEVDSWAD